MVTAINGSSFIKDSVIFIRNILRLIDAIPLRDGIVILPTIRQTKIFMDKLFVAIFQFGILHHAV